MGLAHILVFSALSGISFGFAITAGGDSSGVGINFLVYEKLQEICPKLESISISKAAQLFRLI